MKKLVCVLGFALAALFLNSCGMKECKCVDSNVTLQNDSILVPYSRVDTVYNYTRSDCGEFNKDEMLELDSLMKLHHTIVCEEN